MKYNRDIHHRRSLRLKGYGYSNPGAYFVTICTWGRECYLSNIIDKKIALSNAGKITLSCLKEIPEHFNNVSLDEYIIMPNHIHVIFVIDDATDYRSRGLINQTPTNNNWILMKNPHQTLGKIIRYFKAKSSRYTRKDGLNYFQWQRNYYERIIRNEKELKEIRQYIRNNPLQWILDEENPANIS